MPKPRQAQRLLTFRKAFGKALREMRQEQGMSQEALSFKAGRHDTYIRRLERGTSSPTLDTIFVLAEALGVSTSALLRRVETLLEGE